MYGMTLDDLLEYKDYITMQETLAQAIDKDQAELMKKNSKRR